MTHQHVPPDPGVRRLVNQASERLEPLAIRGEAIARAIELGVPLRMVDDATLDPDELRETATRLCDDDAFAQALPIALYLCAHRDMNADDAFLAGSCMQRLGQAALGARFFAHATVLEGEEPSSATLFRLGECLQAMGEHEQALKSFDAAVEVARLEPCGEEMQALARAEADALRAAV